MNISARLSDRVYRLYRAHYNAKLAEGYTPCTARYIAREKTAKAFYIDIEPVTKAIYRSK